jgi:hypothetical protein
MQPWPHRHPRRDRHIGAFFSAFAAAMMVAATLSGLAAIAGGFLRREAVSRGSRRNKPDQDRYRLWGDRRQPPIALSR